MDLMKSFGSKYFVLSLSLVFVSPLKWGHRHTFCRVKSAHRCTDMLEILLISGSNGWVNIIVQYCFQTYDQITCLGMNQLRVK